MAISHCPLSLGVTFLPVVCPEVTFVPKQTALCGGQTYLSYEKTFRIGFSPVLSVALL